MMDALGGKASRRRRRRVLACVPSWRTDCRQRRCTGMPVFPCHAIVVRRGSV